MSRIESEESDKMKMVGRILRKNGWDKSNTRKRWNNGSNSYDSIDRTDRVKKGRATICIEHLEFISRTQIDTREVA